MPLRHWSIGSPTSTKNILANPLQSPASCPIVLVNPAMLLGNQMRLICPVIIGTPVTWLHGRQFATTRHAMKQRHSTYTTFSGVRGFHRVVIGASFKRLNQVHRTESSKLVPRNGGGNSTQPSNVRPKHGNQPCRYVMRILTMASCTSLSRMRLKS
jgi:hypothetical protein